MKALAAGFFLFGWLFSHTVSSDGVGYTGAGIDTIKEGQFRILRNKWKEVLMGDISASSNPEYAKRMHAIKVSAGKYLTSIHTSDTASYLWPDLKSTTQSGEITEGYNRIKTLAIAYQSKTTGDGHTKPEMKPAILKALDWMHKHRYYIRKPYDNWFAWELGVPMALNDVMVLMYDDLTPRQISDWTAVIDHFCPHNSGDPADYKYWGANRAWRATVHALRGMVGEDEKKMAMARDGLSDLSGTHTGELSVFKYVTKGDGFYRDGSFIQHTGVAYTGGYGKALLSNIADVLGILHQTTWEVTDPEKANVWNWVTNAFMPLLYKQGQMMDMVRGREISRHGSTDIKVGAGVVATILRLSLLAPEPHKTAFRQAVKYWIPNIPEYYSTIPINSITASERLMHDASVTPMKEPVMSKVFTGMDRVVHHRKNWGFGISMNSTRQSYYEVHTYNYENGKGWYTADGMTYLYMDDPFQYSDGYWPTVNMHRLAGTTEDAGLVRADQSGYSWNPLTYSSKSWVGGVSDGVYTVAGMEQDAWGTTLRSKKSWFLFDNEVVALGAGISSTDGRPVHTIIENLKLHSAGTNLLMANGRVQETKADSQTQVFKQAAWIHLQGNGPDAGLGYYFPKTATVLGLREERHGRWSDINRFNTPSGNPVVTNIFQQLWFDHGANPKDAGYAYVLLPAYTPEQTAGYARKPHIVILENSAAAQAVSETRQHITGINFWEDAPASVRMADNKSIISCNRKASVLITETSGDLTVTVSDPTQVNTDPVELMIGKAAGRLILSDDRITVNSLSPQIKLTINLKNTHGQAVIVKFHLTGK